MITSWFHLYTFDQYIDFLTYKVPAIDVLQSSSTEEDPLMNMVSQWVLLNLNISQAQVVYSHEILNLSRNVVDWRKEQMKEANKKQMKEERIGNLTTVSRHAKVIVTPFIWQYTLVLESIWYVGKIFYIYTVLFKFPFSLSILDFWVRSKRAFKPPYGKCFLCVTWWYLWGM